MSERGERCQKCRNVWVAHTFEWDEKDGLIAYILSLPDGEKSVCRTKVKVEVV